jgi:hypothetical protein
MAASWSGRENQRRAQGFAQHVAITQHRTNPLPQKNSSSQINGVNSLAQCRVWRRGSSRCRSHTISASMMGRMDARISCMTGSFQGKAEV